MPFRSLSNSLGKVMYRSYHPTIHILSCQQHDWTKYTECTENSKYRNYVKYIYITRYHFNNCWNSYSLSGHNSQQRHKMSSTWINARMDTSNHGLVHPFKGPKEVANGLTRNKKRERKRKKKIVQCLFIFYWRKYIKGYRCLNR